MFKRTTPNIGDTPGVEVYLPVTCVLFPEMEINMEYLLWM